MEIIFIINNCFERNCIIIKTNHILNDKEYYKKYIKIIFTKCNHYNKIKNILEKINNLRDKAKSIFLMLIINYYT